MAKKRKGNVVNLPNLPRMPQPMSEEDRAKHLHNQRVKILGDQLSEMFKLRAQVLVALSGLKEIRSPAALAIDASVIARQECMRAFEDTVSAMKSIGQEIPPSDFYEWLRSQA